MSPKKKTINPIFNRVRVLRAERDMSRSQLAEAIGVNPQTIGALERGDHYPSLELSVGECATSTWRLLWLVVGLRRM